MKKHTKAWSSSGLMTALVVSMTLVSMVVGVCIFLAVYQRSMTDNTKIASEQAVIQVSNMVDNYTEDTAYILGLVESYYAQEPGERDKNLKALATVRSDVVAVTSYDPALGRRKGSWTGRQLFKEQPLENLSYPAQPAGTAGTEETGGVRVSSPHVESLLVNYYPWVVSYSKRMKDRNGREDMVVLDMRFSQIAHYVDDVGIGNHGYCFIMDRAGNIIYHPQQQLIFAGLKGTELSWLTDMADGTAEADGVIYTVRTREDSGWRIVGVSYLDEMVTDHVRSVVLIVAALLLAALLVTFIGSMFLSRMISRPIQKLVQAMGDFEKEAADFAYQPVHGTREILALSNSFDHMVLRIQELMNKVRNEEISLRKTELRALQAQINPHFLYNTLDSIGWMCEEGRNQDAVEMVNALARLFRISISKGHELIPIEKEVEHARSYLKIQKFRYKKQFRYSFDVEEACLPYFCNKITLQPIIENAITHGLNRMVDEGVIRIGIHAIEDTIEFTVTDNGVGMSEEQCRSILHKEPGDNTGIGIKNVNDRIRIYFGEQYGLRIESEPDVGTKVIITMPKVGEDTYEPK